MDHLSEPEARPDVHLGAERPTGAGPVVDDVVATGPRPEGEAGMFRRGARLIGRSLRAHPGAHTLAILSANVFALAAVGFTVVIGRITDDVIVPALDEGVSDGGRLAGAIAAVVLVALVRGAGVVGRRYFGAMAEFRTQRTGRRAIVEQYLGQPLSFHRDRATGDLLAHADADMDASTMVLKPLPFSVALVSLLVFSLVSLLLVHWLFAVVALVLFPTLLVMNRAYTDRVEVPATAAQNQIGVISGIAHESFDGVLVVKTLGREDAEVERLGDAAETLRRNRVAVGRLRGTFEPAIDALPNLGIVVLLAVGGWLVSDDAVTVGQVVQAMTLFTILALPMRVMGFMLEELPRSVVARDRIDRMLAVPIPPRSAGGRLPHGPLGVDVDDVTYRYGDQVVLDGVRFGVAPGEAVALVGSTGAGKSSLVTLLGGLDGPAAGRILIGGVDAATVDPDELADAVVPVFQETFLFADTLRENLTLGADIDERELWRVAELVRADGFIADLPAGFDTVVGERGVTLSGGQRQRVALARALLRRPRVLLLDDATSAIDPRVEAQVLANLRQAAGATMVIVAHRLSTIEMADRVVYLAGGRVAATGTHQELLAEPAYAALARAYEVATAAEGW